MSYIPVKYVGFLYYSSRVFFLFKSAHTKSKPDLRAVKSVNARRVTPTLKLHNTKPEIRAVT